jgi:hypothetical protein
MGSSRPSSGHFCLDPLNRAERTVIRKQTNLCDIVQNTDERIAILEYNELYDFLQPIITRLPTFGTSAAARSLVLTTRFARKPLKKTH